MSGTYQDFINAIGERESGGNGGYQAQNSQNYLGRYQMGEGALVDAGYVKNDKKYWNNDYSGGWTGKDGINSSSEFLNNPGAQDNAINSYMDRQWSYIKKFELNRYIGSDVGGVPVTASGLLAGAHLVGIGGLKDFLKSNGINVPEDANGTPITEYMRNFGGYSTPYEFGPEKPSLLPNAETPEWLPSEQTPWGGAFRAGSGGGGCPLVLDLGVTGIALSALNSPGSVYWDHNKDGFREASGWVGNVDGLLARDVNGNGVIDNSGELFGNTTGVGFDNGFAALAALDSNGDNKITSADAQWGSLRVWVDANSDGVSQASELKTLSSLGITSINTGYTNVSYTLSGNQVLQESTFTMNGQTRGVIDATFAVDNINSQYAGNYMLDIRSLYFPMQRGYGNLPDLHIAMSLDAANDNECLWLSRCA